MPDQEAARIEIADARGNVLATVNANDVLFHDGQLHAYSDDVTKSAPTRLVKATGKKHAAQ